MVSAGRAAAPAPMCRRASSERGSAQLAGDQSETTCASTCSLAVDTRAPASASCHRQNRHVNRFSKIYLTCRNYLVIFRLDVAARASRRSACRPRSPALDAVRPKTQTLNASVLEPDARRHHRVPPDAERAAARRGAARALRHGDQPDPRGPDAARGRRPGRARAEQGLSRRRGVAREPARSDAHAASRSKPSRCAGRSRKAASNGRPICSARSIACRGRPRSIRRKPDAISEAWSREHADFHTALVAACGSPTLLAIRSRLFEQADRYVALSIMSNGPLRDDVGEHKQLMRAALNRDVDKTLELNRVHITRTLDKVAASLAAGKRGAGRASARVGQTREMTSSEPRRPGRRPRHPGRPARASSSPAVRRGRRAARGGRHGRRRTGRGRSRRSAFAWRHAGRHVCRAAAPGLGVDARGRRHRLGARWRGRARRRPCARPAHRAAGDGDRDRQGASSSPPASCRCATAFISAPPDATRGRPPRPTASASRCATRGR